MTTAQARPTIYSVAACPYAQRTRIMLHMKGIAYDLIELDLSKPRPDWFLAINPEGKVPVLVLDDRPLNESSIINEFLDETFPEVPAFPRDPFARAQARLLIDYCNNKFTTNMYRLLMEQDQSRRGRIEEAARKDFVWLENFLIRTNPHGNFAGEAFGAADLTFAPFFQRYQLNTYFWGFEQPANLPRVERWQRALAEHASVRATSLTHEEYAKLYADYSLGYSNGAIPPGKERSALDPLIPLHERPMPPRRIS